MLVTTFTDRTVSMVKSLKYNILLVMRNGLNQKEDTNNKESIFPIGKRKATEIARKFLEQYHSPVIPKNAVLDKKRWFVSLEVGMSKDDFMEVAVDAETGKILGYTHYFS